MSGLVVDASVVIAWLFDDEGGPRADKVLEHLEEDGALVPHLGIWRPATRCSSQSDAGVFPREGSRSGWMP